MVDDGDGGEVRLAEEEPKEHGRKRTGRTVIRICKHNWSPKTDKDLRLTTENRSHTQVW